MDTTEHTHTKAFTKISEPKIDWAIGSHSVVCLIRLFLNIKALEFIRNIVVKPIVIIKKCFEGHTEIHNLIVF